MHLLCTWLEGNQSIFVESFCVLGAELDMDVFDKNQTSGIN